MEGEAQHVNVQWSIHCGGVKTMDANFFESVIETDQSETTKSDMSNMSLKLTSHECLMAK